MQFISNLLVLLAVPATACAAPDLAAVLRQMDTDSQSFKNLSASVTRVAYTAIVNDKSTESGTMLVRQTKPRAVEMLLDFKVPDPKKVSFENKQVRIAQSGGYPVQQKFYQPSGDYHQATYSNVQLNIALPADAMNLHLPPGVTTEYPQR
jgi:outer membrane lipoprotein-sorting protein